MADETKQNLEEDAQDEEANSYLAESEVESSQDNNLLEILFANDLAKIRKLDKIYSLRKQIYSIQSEALEDY